MTAPSDAVAAPSARRPARGAGKAMGKATAVGGDRDEAIERIAASLLTASRMVTQSRLQEMLCRRAGVHLDRSGSMVLYKLHEGGDDLRLIDLAERLGLDATTVTRKVQQLERDGMIRRSTDPDDARASRLALTAEGRDSIDRLLEARRGWFEELLGSWSLRDRAEFARLLDLFASTIAHHAEVTHGR